LKIEEKSREDVECGTHRLKLQCKGTMEWDSNIHSKKKSMAIDKRDRFKNKTGKIKTERRN